MVIVKIKHGLGNQLFQYATGRSLARHLGTELVLDISAYPPQSFRQYGLGDFMVAPRILGPRARYGIKKFRRKWLTPVRAVAQAAGIIRIMADGHRGFDPTFHRRARIVYLDGFWQSERYFAADRELLLAELTLRAPASPAISPLLARVRAETSVCVHVRRGDYVSAPDGEQHWAICDLAYYQAAMAHIGERTVNARFYFFSDDPAWVQSHFGSSANCVIVSGQMAQSDLDDFRLMMNCRHFIIANSTFSWWAAWLGRAADKIVVAPRQWYRSGKFMDKDLVPERWVRL
jgi:hypothetical protein